MKKTTAAILLGACLFAGCYRGEPNADPVANGPAKAEKKTGYELVFGDDFKAGMNYVDDLGISIVIAMDVSGSMSNAPKSGGTVKYRQATAALQTVTDYIASLAASMPDIRVNVAILSFSSGVKTILPLTELDGSGIERMKAVCVADNFFPKGTTAIGKALERGSEILAQSGTIFNSLIVVTDGENTNPPKPEDVMSAMYANRNNKSTDESPVRTSTQLVSIVTFDVEGPEFDRLHELGARIISASDRAELESGLKGLLEADITKLE